MPSFLIPNSNGEDARPEALREFNTCHAPSDGKFCSGTSVGTVVGITSARPGKSNREVFAQMREFEGELRRIRTVRDVQVQPGLGGYEGGSEATWVVSYKGNGEARRLLARTGQRYQQDAILIMHGGGPTVKGSPVIDYHFEGAVEMSVRKAVHKVLVGHGLGGWTWFKAQGRTVLRAACVPQWGGDPGAHVKAAKKISDTLRRLGLKHSTTGTRLQVEVLEKAGEHSYAAALAH